MLISAVNSFRQQGVARKQIPFGENISFKRKQGEQKKSSHVLKKAGALALALIALKSCMPSGNKDYSFEATQKNAQEMLLNFKFEKADLIYEINNLLNGKELSQDSLDLYYENVKSEDSKIYLSENAGQMMDVLAIASASEGAKEQVKAKEIKPYILRGVQYERTGLFNELEDAVTGEGEPWYYIAGAILSENYPELIDYMPSSEKKALQEMGFWESLADDIKFTIGKGEDYKHYIGDTLERRDFDYATNILSKEGVWNLASDNPWFGPVSVGYALRGKLDNISYMSRSEIKNFRQNYIENKKNHALFAQNETYRNKVISSYILKYMEEAVLENKGKIASGLSALGLQEAGFLDKEMISKLLEQVSEEVPKIHLFENDTKKLDIAIKAFVLAQEGKYENLSVTTRKDIRKFQADNPQSTATSVFMLAEESYFRDFKAKIENYDKIQNELFEKIQKENRNKSEILNSAKNLRDTSNTLLPSLAKEFDVAVITGDNKMSENIKTIEKNMQKQNLQANTIIENIHKYNANFATANYID